MINLRHYQNTMVTGIRTCFRRLYKDTQEHINSVLAVLPTGGGKTVVFTYIAQKMSLKQKKVIILVHRIELLRQTSTALAKFDVEHGIINPNYTPNFVNNVQVASVQTIVKRLPYFAALAWTADAIIIDEAHHATAGSWNKIVQHFKTLNPQLKIIGVTATPIRGDGQGLGVDSGGAFEEIVIGPQVQELIDEGFLVRPRIFGPPEKLDLTGVHTSMGDYKRNELSSLVDKPKITGDAVDHYKEICPGAPAIVFCVSVEHAEHVAQEFRNAGYEFYSVDGTMDDDTRNDIISGLGDGRVQGVTSCDLISEGTDIPRATVAIKLRPTKSKGLNMQQDGRVLRPVYAEGYDLSTKEGRLAAIAASEKPFAIILDHVGNTEAHGLPYQFQEWTLEGITKRSRSGSVETLVRVVMCESCFMQQEPAPVCVGCGHVMKKPVDNTPKQVEGQLREITEADMQQKKAARQEVGKSQTLEELIAIAAQRGYKENWAHIQFGIKQRKIEKLAQQQELNKIMKYGTEIPFTEVPADSFAPDGAFYEGSDAELIYTEAFSVPNVGGFDENLDF